MSSLQRMLSWLVVATLLSVAGCARTDEPAAPGRKTIVATHAVLAAAVKELAGNQFDVVTLVPNGVDLHAWEPSARDIERVTRAALVVENGLGLEHGLEKTIEQARRAGVVVYTAAERVAVRRIGHDERPSNPAGDGHSHDADHDHAAAATSSPAASASADHGVGAEDPHFWTDPTAIDAAMAGLADAICRVFSVDLTAQRAEQARRLQALDAEIRGMVDTLPPARRKLVTGHESLGYFAQRYGFTLIGAVVPGVSTQAESSAAAMGALQKLIGQHRVPAVFTETGAPARTVEALGRAAGVRVVMLSTHVVPEDGSYYSFMRRLAGEIVQGLR